MILALIRTEADRIRKRDIVLTALIRVIVMNGYGEREDLSNVSYSHRSRHPYQAFS